MPLRFILYGFGFEKPQTQGEKRSENIFLTACKGKNNKRVHYPQQKTLLNSATLEAFCSADYMERGMKIGLRLPTRLAERTKKMNAILESMVLWVYI